MAKLTLLQMTQLILSRVGSDECNSISDSPESLQVANMIQNKYYDILSRGDFGDVKEIFQLTDGLDATKPVYMTVPDGIASINWIKYFDTNPADGINITVPSHSVNSSITTTSTFWTTSSSSSVTVGLGSKTFTVATNASSVHFNTSQRVQAVSGSNVMLGTVTSWTGTTLTMNVTAIIGSGTFSSWVISVVTSVAPGYRYVTIVPFVQFMDIVNSMNPANNNVLSYTLNNQGGNFTLYYMNDRQPSYCTVLSNDIVLFDSFDNTQDTTLQASKTMCYGQTIPAFSLTDSFIPSLDDNQFPLLVNEALAVAFYELKQQPNAKVEQEIKRQWSLSQKNKSITNKPAYFDQLANFGRTPNSGGYGGRPDRPFRYYW